MTAGDTTSPRALLDLLEIDLPIIQAPMAGVSTPAMAAAVSNAGGLGSIGVGATNATGARAMIAAVRERSRRSLSVNVFCHRPAVANAAIEAAWIERLRPELDRLHAPLPSALREIYRSFVDDDAMLAALVEARPKVVSFHFGVPSPERVAALRQAGIILFGSATSVREGRLLAAAGVHAVGAQGYEAGGHRGVFDPDAEDDRLGTMALTRLVVRAIDLPVIAAGGIMDGAGIAAALRLGASAAQLGTAFVACAESQADAGFRSALMSDAAYHTVMTRAISGRPARCLANRFTALGAGVSAARDPGVPHRLRRRQGAARGGEGGRRGGVRRAMGGAGGAAGARCCRRRSWWRRSWRRCGRTDEEAPATSVALITARRPPPRAPGECRGSPARSLSRKTSVALRGRGRGRGRLRPCPGSGHGPRQIGHGHAHGWRDPCVWCSNCDSQAQSPCTSLIHTPPWPGPAWVMKMRPASKSPPSATHSAAWASSRPTGSGENRSGERER